MATNACTVAHYTPIHYTLLVKNWTLLDLQEKMMIYGKK